MKHTTFTTLALILTVTTFAAAQTPNSIRYSTPPPQLPPAPPTCSGRMTIEPHHIISAYPLYPTLQVACPASGDLGAPINAALAALPAATGGTWTPDAARQPPPSPLRSRSPCRTRHCCSHAQPSPPPKPSPSRRRRTTPSSPAAPTPQDRPFPAAAPAVSSATPGQPPHSSSATVRTRSTARASSSRTLALAHQRQPCATAIQLYAVERYKLDSLYISGNNATQTGLHRRHRLV